MKIYLDAIIIINFFFDFILLIGTNYLLKRRAKLLRIFLGSLVGSLSLLFLFLPLNSFSLFILKIIISILMILTTFGDKNFTKNYLYFYILSIFLGGTMYFLNHTFSYKNKGLVFFSNGIGINFTIMLILSPILLYFYIKEKKSFNQNYTNYYEVDIYLKRKKYCLTGYLDTGNTLTDPYKKRPVIILNFQKINFGLEESILVPYKTISDQGLIPCIKPDKVVINHKEFKNCLIGQSLKNFQLKNSDCILPNIFREDLL